MIQTSTHRFLSSLRSLGACAALGLTLPPAVLGAQTQTASAISSNAAARPQKRAIAVRVPSGSISVDGKLNDAAWASVPVLADFMQKDPVEGARPTDSLEIRIAYDDE